MGSMNTATITIRPDEETREQLRRIETLLRILTGVTTLRAHDGALYDTGDGLYFEVNGFMFPRPEVATDGLMLYVAPDGRSAKLISMDEKTIINGWRSLP